MNSDGYFGLCIGIGIALGFSFLFNIILLCMLETRINFTENRLKFELEDLEEE